MKAKSVKITAIVIASIIALFIMLVLGYVLYVVFQYNRIDDNTSLDTQNNQQISLKLDTEYTISTYNIGFGAYNHDFSFFLDSGTMLDDTKVSGKDGTAKSKDIVLRNTNGAINTLKDKNLDFMLFQEVDTNSTRSWHVNQYDMLSDAFGADRGHNFGVNFHSAYLLYPFNDPHGKSNAGLATYSKYQVDSSVRRQYPLANGFAKFFDLDRCFTVSRIPLENGKSLTLINSHMSAYDEGGLIRQQQLALLNEVLIAEKTAGNYVVVGGDFNHDIANSVQAFATEQKKPDWVFELSEKDLADGFSFASSNEVPTCRSTDMPYRKGVNYTVVLDGFIVSDDISFEVSNIDTDFEYSDHNPVVMKFKLKNR